MITLLVITDGRDDYIARTIPSALDRLHGPISRQVIYDDSGSEDHQAELADRFPTFEVISHPAGRQGFGGAIRYAWRHMTGRFVFHLEDDFIFHRDVDLAAMANVLDRRTNLVQLALRRQPWNDVERAAGGLIEMQPGAFTDMADEDCNQWLEHRQWFTTNPSLYRRQLCSWGWPEGPHSEGRFSAAVFVDPMLRAGYWGGRDSGEWVEHIGKERAGGGY